jgi:D-galactarolactone cycloisomerase
MRIKHIDILPLAAPLDRPFHWSTGTASVRRTTLVRVHTARGVTGWGETLDPHAAAILSDEVLEAFTGIEVEGGDISLSAVRNKLVDNGAPERAATAALGAVDCAIWDAFSREAERPLASLLHLSRAASVPVYASGIYYGEDVPAVEAAGYVSKGFTRVKMKIGRLPVAVESQRIAVVREAIGSAVLMTDANSAYDLPAALAIAGVLRDSNVLWLEEPFHPERTDLYLRLRAQSHVSVAAGESLEAPMLHRLSDCHAVDWIQPNVTAAGGIADTLSVASAACDRGIGVALHAWGSPIMTATSLQVAAAISPDVMVEIDQTANPLRAIAPDPARFLTSGNVQLGNSPGIGVDVDEATVKAFTV